MSFARALFALGTLLLLQSCDGSWYKASLLPGETEKKNIPESAPDFAAVATLRPAEGEIGNGFAELKCWQARCTHTMRVNLPENHRGAYQAWIQLSGANAFPTAKLEKGDTEGTYFLRFEGTLPSREKYTMGRTIDTLVTWEALGDAEENTPNREVVRGTFTIVQGGE